jgi:hypothetical protein
MGTSYRPTNTQELMPEAFTLPVLADDTSPVLPQTPQRQLDLDLTSGPEYTCTNTANRQLGSPGPREC